MARNKKTVLGIGSSGTGKTFSLKRLILEQGDKVAYIDIDGKGTLPFKGGKAKVNKYIIPSDPLHVNQGIKSLEDNPQIEYIIIDTFSFWVDSIEQKYVIDSDDSRGNWGKIYQKEIKNLLHYINNVSQKTFIILTHEMEGTPERGVVPKKAYVKGATAKLGIEASFNVVFYTAVVPDPESESGVKYIFQVKRTKDAPGNSAKSPEDMFPNAYTEENDILTILDAIDAYDEE